MNPLEEQEAERLRRRARLQGQASPESSRRRVVLHDGTRDATAPVWADVAHTADGATVTLLYDYPDIKPQAGWKVTAGAEAFVVESVSGRALACVPDKGQGGEA